MSDKNYYEMLEGILSFTQDISEEVLKATYYIDVDFTANVFQKLYEFTKNIPDDIKDTKFYYAVQELSNINLKYEDVKWLIDDFGIDGYEDALNGLFCSLDESNKLHMYLKEIIINDDIGKREKIVVILTHIEPFIYDTLNHTKKPKTRIKTMVKQLSLKESDGISTESLFRLFILGITYVIFANTDSYTVEIDKRIPFRNHILHNGIISYTDNEIEAIYDVLVKFLSMLVQAKEIIVLEKTENAII